MAFLFFRIFICNMKIGKRARTNSSTSVRIERVELGFNLMYVERLYWEQYNLNKELPTKSCIHEDQVICSGIVVYICLCEERRWRLQWTLLVENKFDDGSFVYVRAFEVYYGAANLLFTGWISEVERNLTSFRIHPKTKRRAGRQLEISRSETTKEQKTCECIDRCCIYSSA